MILSQTTFSVKDKKKIIEKLKEKYNNLFFPEIDDICPATSSRQQAVDYFSKKVDIILVIGSCRSNNAKELVATATKAGRKSMLVSEISGIKKDALAKATKIGLTAAASTPETEVKKIVRLIKSYYSNISIKEVFTLGKGVF